MKKLVLIGALLLIPIAIAVVLNPVVQLVLRRSVGVDRGGISDAALIQRLLKENQVPGVSIAIIKDFKIVLAVAYGVTNVSTGSLVTTDTMFQAASISKPVAAMASLKAVQDSQFTLDQDINTILKSWKLPGNGFTRERPVTPRTLMSHTSGTGDGFGFPGYAPGISLPTIIQILDGVPPSNVGAVRLERPPLTRSKYSGGGVMIQQLALVDAVGQPFDQIAREWIFEPLQMTNSTFEQPLSPQREKQAARAHSPKGETMGAPWHVYPEQAAAGLWTTPTDLARFAIELQLSLIGRSNRVLSQDVAREMITPVAVGMAPFAVGFQVARKRPYFMHGGGNWGYHCELIAHFTNGYGAVIMTNGANGRRLIDQLGWLIQNEYQWEDAPPW